MAIEDAAALAASIDARPGDLAAGLLAFEAARSRRVEKVARRGAFNRFVWHAAGPVALGRDAMLALRPQASLAADLDWLYGHDAGAV
jgi:salicylate hydroxylase